MVASNANCTDCYFFLKVGFKLTIDLSTTPPICVTIPNPFGDDITTCSPEVLRC